MSGPVSAQGRRWPKPPVVLAVQILDPATVRGLDLPESYAGLARGFGWSIEADSYLEVIFDRELTTMAAESSILTGERPVVPMDATLNYRLRDDEPHLWREHSDFEAFLIASVADIPMDVP